MSSRDRRNHPQRPERDPRGPYGDDRTTSGEDSYEVDVDSDTVDEYSADSAPDDPQRSRFTSERSSAREGEGTAEQINRLRQSMSRGAPRQTPSASQQSIGRNYLSRPEPEPADSTYSDDAYDQTTPQQAGEARYRPASRRRDNVLRQDPYVSANAPIDGSRGTSAYQDEDEDPYYDDEDDFTEYDAPRGTGWQRATTRNGGTQRQPITRPTLPPAITQADLVNDAAALSIIGIGILSLAAMAIFVANQADSLAPTFATHVSASGVLEDFRSSNSLWRLPLLSAMLTLMNIGAAWFISPLDRFASRFLLAAAVVVQLVVWVALIRIL